MTIRCPVILIIIDPDDRRKCVECTTWMTWNCDELRPEDPGGTAVPALHKFVPAQQLRESSPHKNLKENGKNWSSGPLKCPAKVSRRPTKWILPLSKCYYVDSCCPLFHDVSISKRNMTFVQFGPRLWGLQIGSQFAGLAFLHFEVGLQKSLYGASTELPWWSLTRDDPWWPVMTRGDTPPPTVEVHLPASRSVHATPADHKWNSKIQQELQQWDCCSHLFAIVTFTKNNRLSSKWACSSHCLQPAFGLDCLDTYLKEPRLQKKVLCISMHFYAHVTAVRQLRGEKLLILSNSLQKVDSSHQLPWRKWMTGWHWSRNIKETLCLPVNETDQDWKPMKTQGPLAKNCPSKLSKSVKFTGVLEKELLDWWQA